MQHIRRIVVITLLAAAAFIPLQGGAAEVAFGPKLFTELLDAGKPVVVHFHSRWCGTCRQQAKVLTLLLQDEAFKDITVLRANYGSEDELRKELNVNNRSTLVTFKAGKEAARSTGQTSKEEIEKILRAAL
jgi:thioredoxin 1